jgi:hypothetical protein
LPTVANLDDFGIDPGPAAERRSRADLPRRRLLI